MKKQKQKLKIQKVVIYKLKKNLFFRSLKMVSNFFKPITANIDHRNRTLS